MRTGILRLGLLWAATTVLARTELIAEDSTPANSDLSRVLGQVKADGQKEASRISGEQSQNSSDLSRLQQQYQNAVNHADTSGEMKVLQDSSQKLQDTFKTLSPDAQKIVAQSNAPVMRAPDPDTAKTPTAAQGPGGVAITVAPNAAQDKNKDKPDPNAIGAPPPDKDVHITCAGICYIDANDMIGIYTDDVEVIHPGFHLFCEQLEIYMLKDNEKPKPVGAPGAAAAPGAPAPAAGTAPPPKKTAGLAPPGLGGAMMAAGVARAADPDAPAAPAAQVGRAADPDAPAGAAPAGAPGTAAPAAGAPGADAKPQQDNSIRLAIARGRKVIIIKNTENGDVQIGVCRTCTYIGATGDIILRDMPSVQRGKNVQFATDPSTYMVIHQNGKMDTHGPSKTDIIQEEEKQPGAPAPVAAAPPTPPPPAAKPAKPAGAGPKKKFP